MQNRGKCLLVLYSFSILIIYLVYNKTDGCVLYNNKDK